MIKVVDGQKENLVPFVFILSVHLEMRKFKKMIVKEKLVGFSWKSLLNDFVMFLSCKYS